MNDKVILTEEMNRMKNLFGYKAGKVISEQLENTKNLQEQVPNVVGGNLGRDASADLNAAEKEKNDTNYNSQFLGGNEEFSDQQKQLQTTFCSVKNGKITSPQPFYGSIGDNSWKSFFDEYYNLKASDGRVYLNDTMLTIAVKSCPNSELGKYYSYLINKNQPVNPQIPKQLGDVKGVKKFQEWLNTQTPTWVNGKTLQLDPNRGYGRFGPLTSASWNKLKDIYLKEIESLQANQKVVANPELASTAAAPTQAAKITAPVKPVGK